MLRLMSRTAGFVVLLVVAHVALAQTEFSADMVDTAKTGMVKQSKIYFAKDKMRFELANSGGSSAMRMGAVIINLTTQTSTVLMDQQHMYMEMPMQASQQQSLSYFFRTGDVENVCADWLGEARNKGGSCHKVGSETVNGRSTVKYEGTNSRGEPYTFWMDPKLRFPVKWLDKNGSGELRNIQEGSQAASLFEIPAGYNKMDMGAMMKQRPQ